jgi:hypothetical protein
MLIVPDTQLTTFQRVQTLATKLFASNSIALVASGNPDPVLAESTQWNQLSRLCISIADEKSPDSGLPRSD